MEQAYPVVVVIIMLFVRLCSSGRSGRTCRLDIFGTGAHSAVLRSTLHNSVAITRSLAHNSDGWHDAQHDRDAENCDEQQSSLQLLLAWIPRQVSFRLVSVTEHEHVDQSDQ